MRLHLPVLVASTFRRGRRIPRCHSYGRRPLQDRRESSQHPPDDRGKARRMNPKTLCCYHVVVSCSASPIGWHNCDPAKGRLYWRTAWCQTRNVKFRRWSRLCRFRCVVVDAASNTRFRMIGRARQCAAKGAGRCCAFLCLLCRSRSPLSRPQSPSLRVPIR